MTTLNQIATIQTEPGLAKGLVTLAAALSEKIDAWNQRAAEHCANCRALAEKPADTVDPAELFNTSAARTGFELRREEKALRAEMAEFFNARNLDRIRRAEVNNGKVEKARANVIEKLESGGWVNNGGRWDNTVPSCIFPGMIHNSKPVRDVEAAVANALALVGSTHEAATNADRLAMVGQELNDIRRRAAAA